MSGPSSGSRSGDSLLYAEWTTINATEICELNRKSVLYKLRTAINGQGVVDSVVKSLVLSFNGPVSGNVADVGSDTSHQQQQPEYLETDRDVQWVMEVICYGLSLPITTPEQHDGVRDCVKIYCEWMSAVIPAKSTDRLIPFPIRDDPNRYFRLIIQHLYNIFVRRPSHANTSVNFPAGKAQPDLTANDVANRQAVLCHRILRTLESICADDDNILDNESWDGILIFLLAINDILLSVPVDREDIGTHMCDRIVKSLFDVWLISCHKCFPSPSFWKTFHELCLRIRHRLAVIEHWNNVCLSITQRLVHLSYTSTTTSTTASTATPASSTFPVLQRMSYDVVSQTWFRFLHILGNPVDLCYPHCNATSASRPRAVSDESDRPVLPVPTGLPDNFKCAMRGVSQLVSTFLGTTIASKETTPLSQSAATAHSPVVPRRPSTAQKQAAVTTKAHLPFLTSIAGRGANPQVHQTLAGNQQQVLPPAPPVISLPSPPVPLTSTSSLIRMSSSRPKVNSILHSLGSWLFSAALIGSDFLKNPAHGADEVDGATLSLDNSASRRGSVGASSQGSNACIADFESGQAEAVGALCRLFSSKRTDEDVSPVYLARFYLVVQHGLSLKDSLRPAVLHSILINSTKLFQLDLNGVNILIPHFIRALEWVTTDQRTTGASQIDLRRASVAILSSLMAYPLHFNSLPIKDCLTETTSVTTFQSLWPRLVTVLINSLRTETDSTNAQHLLISLLTCVQDLAQYEFQKGVNNSLASGHQKKELPDSHVADVISASDVGTAHGLFISTLHYACHNLTSNWRNDTHFSLTALEVLSALAKIRLPLADQTVSAGVQNECKKTVKGVSDYIVNQCSRPPPCHVKDMHSTIVAAYQCLTIWFHEHPEFLQDHSCVSTVLEVIELGVSGSKSRTTNGIVVKSEKQLKPVSMRVKDAAETLLSALMNHFGFCPPSPCPPASITGTQLLDEVSLLKYAKIVTNSPPEECVKNFRYFVNDNSILLSILKDCVGDECMIIIRSAFGKYCWTLKNQLIPISKANHSVPDVVPRPIPASHSMSKFKFACKYFPDSVDRIPLTKLDIVVPTLDSVVNSSPQRKQEDEKQRQMLHRQAQLEIEAQKKISARNQMNRPLECREPIPSHALEPVRLILTHCGLLHDKSCFEVNPETHLTPMVAVDHNQADLWNHLKTLDLISTRTSDTVFVYYMRKGRSDPQEILNSVSSKHYVTQVFMDFLHSLGDVIDVRRHTGWTGKVSSSWKTEQETSVSDDFGDPGLDHGGCAFDGQRKAIYWADVSHELVFVVPSGRYVEDEITAMDGEQRQRVNAEAMSTGGRSMSSDEGTSVSSRSYSDTSSRSSLRNKFKQLSLMSNIGCDTKVLVLWLESADDAVDVPIDCLLSTTRTGGDNESLRDFFALLVHPLKNGLFRIGFVTSSSRNGSVNPLLDGVVVNRRILGTFVRMTTLNYCRRRRLDAESFQPPHVKRRLKIQDIANKFHMSQDQSDFFTSIFV